MTWRLLKKLLRFVCPDQLVSKVTDISLTDLWESGIRVIFVDLDNTLTTLGGRDGSDPTRQWLD
ncbi:MAG: YqeG family HAD IIIA-type phosphatase, partial [Candidatus Fervidibacter sp.]